MKGMVYFMGKINGTETRYSSPARSRGSRLWNKNKYALLFLAPWLVGVLVLNLAPMIISLFLSFTNYDMFKVPDFIGLANYQQMFTNDPRFIKAVEVTFRYVGLGVPLELIISLSFAMLLNKGIKGLSLYRAMYYIPSLLGGSVAISILWRQVFGSTGLINQFLAPLGVEKISWITSPKYALYTLVILRVWQFGAPMIIFLAGLRQIPKELYEAAHIDGADSRQSFFHITLPQLSPIIFFNLIMQLVSAFQAFTPAYVVGNGTGGAMDSILFYTLYLYEKAFQHFQMGYASAMAWLLLIMIGIVTGILFFISRKRVYYIS